MLDTYSREMITTHYGYQKLSMSDEKRITYKLSQIHAQLLCFKGHLDCYDTRRVAEYFEQHITNEMDDLIMRLISTTQEHLKIHELASELLWLNYANILIAINLSLYKNLTVGIDLANLFNLSDSLYYFLLSELSSLPQVRFEKYQEHEYYDLVLTTREKPILGKTNYYYLSEFISTYDISKIKAIINKIKDEKNNYQK